MALPPLPLLLLCQPGNFLQLLPGQQRPSGPPRPNGAAPPFQSPMMSHSPKTKWCCTSIPIPNDVSLSQDQMALHLHSNPQRCLTLPILQEATLALDHHKTHTRCAGLTIDDSRGALT
ncbi:hypothetical protein BDR06DRAFT_1015243 [Suillus hirtellus]|nr:hypothetical protein BDR06DRAFT_1015243 [Suillus hirtellus]